LRVFSAQTTFVALHPIGVHFFPLPLLFIAALFMLIMVWFVSVEIGVLEYAYAKMGVHPRYFFALLVFSLLGSYVNIPIAHFPPETMEPAGVVPFFGMRHVVPFVPEYRGTLLAVNVGGAVVPVLLSIYLVVKNRVYASAAIGVAVVAAVVHSMAQPIRGVGIAVPVFLPPILAILVATLTARDKAPAVAYVAGSIGTLVGGDILNLGAVAGLGAPVASIGGAGTFDGVFLTGLIAALFA